MSEKRRPSTRVTWIGSLATVAENTFKIFDAIATGNSAAALTLLDRLFEQGEEPIRMLGAFSLQLRRLAQAGA